MEHTSFSCILQVKPFSQERKHLYTQNSAILSAEYADQPIPQTGRNMRPISLSMQDRRRYLRVNEAEFGLRLIPS
ncbi:hypothetical protein OWV82_020743 [Melia azedarach]|uniref:Uncharacterized protein n=1 Tax=Melia azedarach TaxID=155640 RepID=A0ACC1X7U0_MELAZ|nr:hypothetical protein OWV82_020743 [Melia azedarach]